MTYVYEYLGMHIQFHKISYVITECYSFDSTFSCRPSSVIVHERLTCGKDEKQLKFEIALLIFYQHSLAVPSPCAQRKGQTVW